MLRGALSPRPILEKRLAPENFPPPLLDAEEMPDGTYHILGVHHVRPSRGPSALGRVASNELLQTAVPTAVPTATPTVTPTLVPSMPPSPTPTDVPSAIPTALDHHEDEAAKVSRSAVGLLRAQQARLSAHAKLKGALSGKAEADGSYLAALQVQVESALQGNPAVIIGLATASGVVFIALLVVAVLAYSRWWTQSGEAWWSTADQHEERRTALPKVDYSKKPRKPTWRHSVSAPKKPSVSDGQATTIAVEDGDVSMKKKPSLPYGTLASSLFDASHHAKDEKAPIPVPGPTPHLDPACAQQPTGSSAR